MRKLIILDYTSSAVHIFCVSKDVTVDDEFIELLGFHTSACHWMEGDLEIIQHKGILE